MTVEVYNILHLTDLHYTNRTSRNRDQAAVLTALFEDIEHITLTGLKPDVIVFNGDLVNDADEDGILFSVFEQFLEPLLQKTRLTGERLIIAPGNHDLMRSAVKANLTIHRKFFKEFDLQATNDFYATADFASLQQAKLKNFADIYELCEAPALNLERNYTVVDFPTLDTVFCISNSGFSSAGGLRTVCKDDYGKLVIAEHQIAALCDSTISSKRKLKMFVAHHPREWFKEDCGRAFERQIINAFDGHFAGHVHLTDPMAIAANQGNCVRFQIGALQDKDAPWNGYSIIRVAPQFGHFEVLPRRYVPEFQKFISANEFGENGAFYPTPAARAYWRSRQPVNKSALSKWVDEKLKLHFETRHGVTLVGRSLGEVFQEHPMQTRMPDYEKTDTKIISKNDITFDVICNSTENFAIFGDTNYGKSTLIKRIALELITRCADPQSLSIPTLFEFCDISLAGDGVLKAIRACAPGLDEEISLRQLLSAGVLTILVDDVDPADERRLEALMAFTEIFPRCRYIFTATPPLGLSINIVAKFDKAVSFKEISLLPLRARGIRAFTERHFGIATEPEQCERVVDKIISTLKKAALPPTAFTVSVLLEVFDGLKGDVLINEVTLIERFVEFLLMKEKTTEAARSTFNFGDKVRCLGYLAMKMCQRNQYDMMYDELLAIIKSYIDEIGFPHNPKDILDRFITQKVLRRTVIGHYRFYLRAFLEYFIAQRMSTDGAFYDWITEESRYLTYVHEIEFYCGLPQNQDKTETLESVAVRHRLIMDSVRQTISRDIDFDSIELPSGRDGGTMSDLAEQLAAPRLSRAEREELIDTDLAVNETNQDAFRPKVNLETQLLLSLFLYSSILRNLEHLPKREKEEHLAVVLNSWITFLGYSFWTIPSIVKHRAIRVNGVEYRTVSRALMSDERLARQLMLYLPSAVTAMMRTYLSSEKMLKQVEFEMNDNKPTIEKVVRAFMLADLDVSDWPAVMAALKDVVHGKTYLSGAIIWKLNSILKMRDPSREKAERTIEILARIYAEQSSDDPSQINKNYSHKLQELEKALRIRELKIASEKKLARISIRALPRNASDNSL